MKKLILISLLVINTGIVFAKEGTVAISRANGEIKVELLGIVCDFCARSLEKVFSKQKTIQSINVDLDTNTMILKLKANQDISNESLKKLVEDAGYEVSN